MNKLNNFLDKQKKLMGFSKTTNNNNTSINENREQIRTTNLSLDDYVVKYQNKSYFVELKAEISFYYEHPSKEYGHGEHLIGGGFFIEDVNVSDINIYDQNENEVENPIIVKNIFYNIIQLIKKGELNNYIDFENHTDDIDLNEGIIDMLGGMRNVLKKSILDPYKEGKSITSFNNLLSKGNKTFTEIRNILNKNTEVFVSIEDLMKNLNSLDYESLDDSTKEKYKSEFEKILVLRQSIIDIINVEQENIKKLSDNLKNTSKEKKRVDLSTTDLDNIANYLNENNSLQENQTFDSDHKLIFGELVNYSNYLGSKISSKFNNKVDPELIAGLLKSTFSSLSQASASKFYKSLGGDSLAYYRNITKNTGGLHKINTKEKSYYDNIAQKNAIKYLEDNDYIVDDESVNHVKNIILQKIYSKLKGIETNLDNFDSEI